MPPDFHFDANVLEDAFRQHPKAIILCNPSNPCGKVFTRAELEIIASLAEKYDTYVITDEVYEHIVFAPNKHTYFATLPGMWERSHARRFQDVLVTGLTGLYHRSAGDHHRPCEKGA